MSFVLITLSLPFVKSVFWHYHTTVSANRHVLTDNLPENMQIK